MIRKGQDALLAWAKKNTADYGVSVNNFHTSWRDGLAFGALLAHFRPDVCDFSSLQKETELQRHQLVFAKAEMIGIPKLLDAEDMLIGDKPDHFSVITYLSQWYHYFNNTRSGGVASIQHSDSPVAASTANTSSPNSASRLSTAAAPPRNSTNATVTSTSTRQSASSGAQYSDRARQQSVTIASDEAPKCQKCGKAASGIMVTFNERMYHSACFSCSTCSRQFKNTCLNIEGKPYCETCGKKAFIRSRIEKRQTASSSETYNPASRPASSVLSPPTSTTSSSTSSRPSSVAPPASNDSTPFSRPSSSVQSATTTQTSPTSTQELTQQQQQQMLRDRLSSSSDKEKARMEILRQEQLRAAAKREAQEKLIKEREAAAKAEEAKRIQEEAARQQRLDEERKALQAERDRLENTRRQRTEQEAKAKEERERAEKQRAEKEAQEKLAKEREEPAAELAAATTPTTATVLSSPSSPAAPRSSPFAMFHSRLEQEREELDKMDKEIMVKQDARRSEAASAEIPEWQLRATQLGQLRDLRKAGADSAGVSRPTATSVALPLPTSSYQKESQQAKQQPTTSKDLRSNTVSIVQQTPTMPLPSNNDASKKDAPAMKIDNSASISIEDKKVVSPATSPNTTFELPDLENPRAKHPPPPSRIASAAVVSPTIQHAQLNQQQAAIESMPAGGSNSVPNLEDSEDLMLEPYEAQEIDYEMKIKSQRLRRYDVKRILDGQDGYLKKRTKQMGGKVWSSRWFSLQGPRLLYYKTAPGKFATAHENPPHAFISLQFVTSIDKDTKSSTRFSIVTPDLTWELEAASDAEREIWMDAINHAKDYYNAASKSAITTLEHSPLSQSELHAKKEGILTKKGKLGKWSERHFILQDGILFYFTHKGAKRRGRLPLLGCVLEEHDHSIYSFTVTNVHGEIYYLAAKDEVEMQTWCTAILKQKLAIEEQIDMISF